MSAAGSGGRAGPLPPAPAADRGTLPEPQVRAMFDRIARVYDVLNSVMTAGLHHQWRRRAVEIAGIGAGDRVLDVATGTGDLAIELVKHIAPGGEVIGSDFSEGMLALARKKAPEITFAWGNVMELPYADDEFDAVTVGFGARNFSDLDRGLAELTRVVRPGGRVMILEMTTPQRPPLSLFFRVWFDGLVPLIGKLSGGGEAYDYLPNSVKRWPDPAGLAAALERAGLQQIRWVLTAGGIIATHVGVKPGAPILTSRNGTHPGP